MIVPFLAHSQGRRENQILSFTNSLSTSCLGQRSRAVAVNPTYKNPHSGGTYILEGEGRQYQNMYADRRVLWTNVNQSRKEDGDAGGELNFVVFAFSCKMVRQASLTG